MALGQEAQTLGIPIGPDTSFALAELLMSRVDETFYGLLPRPLRGTVSGTRLHDDYELYVPDRSAALRVTAALQQAMGEWS